MNFRHRIKVAAAPEAVWRQLMNIPAVALCVPGVSEVAPVGDDRYRGALDLGVGPIRLALTGEVHVVKRDDRARSAVLEGQADDRRLAGSVRARIGLVAVPIDAVGTTSEVTVDSDVQVLGRIGQLGQPLMKRKADEVMGQFAKNLGRLLED